MRDAFGGIFMIRLMLVFLFIYVAFTAVSLNYAKAFRIKNQVIDFVEQNQILDLDAYFRSGTGTNLAKLDSILNSASYNKECANENGLIDARVGEPQVYCYRGIVIEEAGSDKNAIYYNVYTYANWNLGALNMLLKLTGTSNRSDAVVDGAWEISGKAKVVKVK